jgi:hypothetical protein
METATFPQTAAGRWAFFRTKKWCVGTRASKYPDKGRNPVSGMAHWTTLGQWLVFSILFGVISSPAVADPTPSGLSRQCLDSGFARKCPTTCARNCASSASTQQDLRACLEIVKAVQAGESDQASCPKTSGQTTLQGATSDLAGGRTDSRAADKLRARCSEQSFARDCPEICRGVCENSTADMLDACIVVVHRLLAGEKDRPSCTSRTTIYADCAKEVDARFADFRAPPPPDGALQTVYQDRPNCATPIQRLRANFLCLQGDAEQIAVGVKELEDRGLTGIADIDRLCALKEDELAYFTDLSEHLIQSGKTLVESFATLESCRNSLISWTEKLKGACGNSKLPNCAVIVDSLARARQPMMDQITSLAGGMKEQIGKAEIELRNITFLRSALLDCGVDGNLPVDQLQRNPPAHETGARPKSASPGIAPSTRH